ncbi:hypothetical protein E3T46_09120 [Cryobacterium sp. Hh11]|uniref:hypothetical protein n=1 Tax=Cryobacterium sp. Hh11 TaxID=2555868 RepID=UPI00106B8AB6|nr:hypothetical protein [Cryobacterium sp. Hh11]TFD51387.1 hypothetical protein E3T46_09120 [Cryobacterium sp. Hh11]
MAVTATGQAADPREPTISLIELTEITIRLTDAISTNAGQHSRDLPGRIFRRDHAAYQAGFQTHEWDESDFSRVKTGSRGTLQTPRRPGTRITGWSRTYRQDNEKSRRKRSKLPISTPEHDNIRRYVRING